MRRLVFAALFTAVAVVLGTGVPVAAAEGRRPTHHRMREALLRADAMPAGFRLTDRGDDGMGDLFQAGTRCDHQPGDGEEEELPRSVYAIFVRNGSGPQVIVAIGATGRTLAHEMVGALSDLADHCPVLPGPDAPTTVARLPFPRFGDASIAVLVNTPRQAGGTATEQSMVGIVAYRDLCLVVQHSGVDELDVDAVETILRRATRRLIRVSRRN